jgi:multiple sugar transport system substrate-binding protein
VFYNKRLLDTSLLPSQTDREPVPQSNGWSWNQFTVAAAQMSRGPVKGVYLPPRLTTLTPLMRSAGSDIVDDAKNPTSLTLSPPSNRNDVERILDVARNQTVSLTPAELAKQGPVSRFTHGKLGMMVGTRALVPLLRKNRELRFDVYPMPSLGRSGTIAEVSGLCINRETQHQAQAADFLAFASGDRGAAITARSGAVVPANINVQGSDAFVQADRFPLDVDVFTRVIRRATTMPNPPAWHEVVRQTQPLVRKLFYAPRADFDVLLPRIDEISVPLLAQDTETPSPTESPSGSATEPPGSSSPETLTPSSPTGSPKRTHGPSPD